MDVLVSLLLLTILSPVLIAIAIIVIVDSGRPVLFRQIRCGMNHSRFTIYKFRSMRQGDGLAVTSANDSRITKVGRFLRKFKLDELPQLINVLKGDMSIVGPRPEVPEFVALFSKDFDEILRVRPGLTDWASLQFIDEERILERFSNPRDGYIKEVLPQKIRLQKKYAETHGLAEDLKIVLLTAAHLLKKIP